MTAGATRHKKRASHKFKGIVNKTWCPLEHTITIAQEIIKVKNEQLLVTPCIVCFFNPPYITWQLLIHHCQQLPKREREKGLGEGEGKEGRGREKNFVYLVQTDPPIRDYAISDKSAEERP